MAKRVEFIFKRMYKGWRLKYAGEGGPQNPTGMPAVAPALRWNGYWNKYIAPVKMTKQIQLLQWDVMQIKNIDVLPDRYTQTYHQAIALANNNGYGDPKDPRANFITKENESSPLPKLMDGIIMAGHLYDGEPNGNVIEQYPNVHAMSQQMLVDAQTALDNNWCFQCVSWHAGNGGYGEDFFPRRGGEYWVAHIISETATYPKDYFEWWNKDYPPNPLKMGG